MSVAGFADALEIRYERDPKMPFSEQRVLDERNDHAVRTSSAESIDESCRYSSHEHSEHTVKHL